MSTQKMTGGSA